MKKYLLILLVILFGCEKEESTCKVFVKDESKLNVTRITIQYEAGHEELDRFQARNGGQWVDLNGDFKFVEFEVYQDQNYSSSIYEWPVCCGDSIIYKPNRQIIVR